MYTYLGNKRKLLDGIMDSVIDVKKRMGKDRLRLMDGFTGSTVVARALVAHASELHSNDLELYSHLASNCFLKRPTETQQRAIRYHIETMNSITEFTPGLVTELYAPPDTENIKHGDRCFFTHENALRIDTWRKYIDTIDPDLRDWCLVPILVQMSIHTNTMGHFRAFIKDKNDIGTFNTTGRTAPLVLQCPVWHTCEVDVHTHNMSTNTLVKSMPDDSLDLIYYDPPYNHHEYGAFYFLLNVVAKNERPVNMNAVTGLPKDRVKSDYNSKRFVFDAMKELLAESTRVSKYVLISYNDEGIIGDADWQKLLEPYQSERHLKTYQRYTGRGSKTGEGRGEVQEILYLITLAKGDARPVPAHT
jgi:adenine-specific DNA-methyltransferase